MLRRKRRLAAVFTLLFISTSSFAQINKGNWMVGGGGSFYSYDEDYTAPSLDVTAKYTSVDLSASVGYFIVDKLSGGLRPYFSSFKGKSSGGGSTNSYRLAVGPFARYYFLKADKQFNLLTDVSYQFGVNQRLGALHSKGRYNNLSIMAGTEMFFNTTAGIEFLFGFTQQKISIDNSADEFNSNKRGVQVSIGFQLHLEKD